jgi:hypothetical protein
MVAPDRTARSKDQNKNFCNKKKAGYIKTSALVEVVDTYLQIWL